MIDDKDPAQLFEYCSNVREVLKTVNQGGNADSESVVLALKDLERCVDWSSSTCPSPNNSRFTEEIGWILKRGANVQPIKHRKGKVEEQKATIQETLNPFNTPNVALDPTIPMASRNTATSGPGGGTSSTPPSPILYGVLITDYSCFLNFNGLVSRALAKRAFAPHGLPSLIEVIFSSNDEAYTIHRLLGDDAQAFIDVIDEARLTYTHPSLQTHANRN